MSTVLYIIANVKPEGVSRTFRISDKFIESYKANHTNDHIIAIDLSKEGVSFLNGNDLYRLWP
jgi:FMN-dependent NADH-azoreductase